MGEFEAFLGVNPWTALFTLLNTVTIYLVGKKFLLGPIMKVVKNRQQEIDDLYADANSAKEGALAMEAEYKEKLAAATETSEALVKEAVARGQQRQEEILRDANRQASAILEKASADIAQEKKKALNEAKDEITVIAMSIATKVVGQELTGAHQAALVDNFIAELGDAQ